MVFEYSDYRQFLKHELTSRIAKNASYSLRAFSKYLEMAPNSLSQVLSGKKNISLEKALKIANTLELSKSESEYFQLLVQLHLTKDLQLKERILERIQLQNPKAQLTDLSVEYFKVISDWYHFAILVLTELKDFVLTPENAAARLNIHKYEAEAAIERLVSMELMVEDKTSPSGYRKTKGPLMVTSTVPNQTLKKYHKQILDFAKAAVDNQRPDERILRSETIALSEADLVELDKHMEEFYAKALQLSQKQKNKTHVYHMGVQIFKLTREN